MHVALQETPKYEQSLSSLADHLCRALSTTQENERRYHLREALQISICLRTLGFDSFA